LVEIASQGPSSNTDCFKHFANFVDPDPAQRPRPSMVDITLPVERKKVKIRNALSNRRLFLGHDSSDRKPYLGASSLKAIAGDEWYLEKLNHNVFEIVNVESGLRIFAEGQKADWRGLLAGKVGASELGIGVTGDRATTCYHEKLCGWYFKPLNGVSYALESISGRRLFAREKNALEGEGTNDLFSKGLGRAGLGAETRFQDSEDQEWVIDQVDVEDDSFSAPHPAPAPDGPIRSGQSAELGSASNWVLSGTGQHLGSSSGSDQYQTAESGHVSDSSSSSTTTNGSGGGDGSSSSKSSSSGQYEVQWHPKNARP